MGTNRHFSRFRLAAFAAAIFGVASAQTDAATLTWLGTLGTSWSTSTGGTSNWSGNAVPATGDTLVFTGGSNLNTVNDLAGLTLSGTAAGSGGYSLNLNSNSTINVGGSQLLTIGAGSSGEIQLVGTGTHTISAPMFLKDAGFFIRFNGVKTISGVMSGTVGAGGPDEVGLRGDSDTDRLILSGNNTYQGYTKTLIDRGVIQANSLGNANESGSLGKGSEIWGGVLNWNATIDYVGAGNSTDRKLMIGRYTTETGGMGVLSNGSGALVFTSSTLNSYLNATNITANRTLTLGGTNSADNTIQSVITNNKATGGGSGFSDTQGTISIAKNDAGRWILSGNNSYTGTTTISAGLLIAGHANALGSTYAGTTVSSGASLGLQGGITTAAEALSITGTGMSNAGALRNLSNANTYSGTVTLAGDSTIGADAGTLTVSGPITGTSQVLTVVGSGTVTLSNAANTFGSGLTGNNVGLFIRGGNVRNGVANAVNSNVMATVESGTWDLAGYNQSVRTTFSKGLGLGGAAGTAVVNTGTGVLTLLADSTSQQSRIDYLSAGNGQGGVINGQLQYSNSNNLMYFYVEDSSNAAEDLTINATISKAGSPNTGVFFKGGAGSMLLNGMNSFNAAALRVDSGSMILGANDPANGSAGSLGTGISSITVGYNDPNVFNASLLLRSGVTSSRSIATLNNTNSGHSTDTRTLGGYDSTGTATFSGAVELNNAATDGGTTRLQALGTSTVTFSGNISDNPGDTAVGINKIGGGTVVLSGSNSFRGATTVSAGIVSIGSANALLGTSGVSIADGAGLTYTGGATTFGKNITISSGTGTVRNSGAGTLALSGTLTKNGTVLRLTGGSFNVTGQIVGASANSDLLVDGTSTVTLSTANTYNGPTFVNQSSNLVLGINNAIPSGSVVTLGNATTTGTLTAGSFTNALGGLAFGAAGGTLRMTASSTSAAPLTAATGTMTLTNGTLDLAGSGTSAGLYRLLSAQSIGGSFASVTGTSAAYKLVSTSTSVDYQQRAVLGAVSVTNPSSAIITGGSAAFTFSVANGALSGGESLSFTAAALSNVSGSASGSALGGGSSGSLSGFTFTGTSVGSGQNGTFTVSAPSAYGATSATGTVSVTVLDHATSSLSGAGVLTSTILNLGTWDYSQNAWTSGSNSAGFTIYNLASTFGAGLTADLSLVSVSGTGNGFTTNLSSYTDIAGGSSGLYTVAVNPTSFLTSGTQSWIFTIGMSDKTGMSGAQGTNTLTVTANVVVVPEPGALALAGIGAAAAAWILRRRK